MEHTEQDLQSDALGRQLPKAMVAGEALRSWPEDLYIPPDALEIILEAFFDFRIRKYFCAAT